MRPQSIEQPNPDPTFDQPSSSDQSIPTTITTLESKPTQASPTYRLAIKDEQGITCAVPLKSDQPIRIGRGSTADLSVPSDEAMSRTHATIELTEVGVSIQDLGSANGVCIKVNDATIINPGDEIYIGQTVLVVEQVNEPASEECSSCQ